MDFENPKSEEGNGLLGIHWSDFYFSIVIISKSKLEDSRILRLLPSHDYLPLQYPAASTTNVTVSEPFNCQVYVTFDLFPTKNKEG